MAQTPSELRPFESPFHYLGAELRAWRVLRGYSLARLGSVVHVSGDLLGKIEKAQRRPTEDLVERCDQALNTSGILVQLYELACCRHFEHAQVGAAQGRQQSISASGRVGPEQSDSVGYEHVADVASLAVYRRRRLTPASYRSHRAY
ncbi:helix-turn-helix transcriptional regulator [Dactylosporangium sp. NPDC051485]|uniref:helix-turn-helix domain-containing protein n=1 Tax=Dactylosporangium sp. NPDC051485 TaxID=3154846 RepID=UPI003434F55E